MGILGKFILRSIAEKKLRTFLILFSIAVTTALFFASNTVSDTLKSMSLERLKQMAGSADIVIIPGKDSNAPPYFSLLKAKSLSADMEYAIGAIHSKAIYEINSRETVYAGVVGMDHEDLMFFNPPVFLEKDPLSTFEGNKIYISSHTSTKYQLHTGNEVQLQISGKNRKFTVAGICSPQGLFVDESSGMLLVMPKRTLAMICGQGEKVNSIYIKLKDRSNLDTLIKKLEAVYRDSIVKEPITKEDIRRAVSNMTTPFKMVILLVIIISIFIIYTSFRVIILERIPAIGTFRSLGATKTTTSAVMIIESIVYGTIGGLTGCLLGIGVLYVMAVVNAPEGVKRADITIHFSFLQLSAALMFAVALSFISALLPILSTGKLSIKNIIMNILEKNKGKGNGAVWAGFAMMAVSITVPLLLPDIPLLILIVDNICMCLALFSVILLIPFLTGKACILLGKLYQQVLGNEGGLAAKNLIGNRSLINNITLLAIGISSILLINTINKSISDEVLNVYEKSVKFDISMSCSEADSRFINQLSKSTGVEKAAGTYEMSSVLVENKDKYIGYLYGIDHDSYFDFWNMEFTEADKKRLAQLSSGRNIVLTKNLKDLLEVQEGELITLDLGSTKQQYKVLCFVDTLWMNGNLALVPEKYIKKDAGFLYFTNIYIKTSQEATAVQKSLKRKYLNEIHEIVTKNEMLQRNQDGITSIFIILKGFSLLAMLIGVIGIINNIMITFIERRRSFAIYRSIGMSKRQLKKILIIESATTGFLGGVLGILAAALMIMIIPNVLSAMMGPITMHYSIGEFAAYFIAAIVIMTSASLIPALKSSKLSIIHSIKYE
ncbi:MAG: ABC transporter permease [Clostridia bacterium]|nr:ABC transporter permease [Clostridia bacterium]